jgi:hypothetical protein
VRNQLFRHGRGYAFGIAEQLLGEALRERTSGPEPTFSG